MNDMDTVIDTEEIRKIEDHLAENAMHRIQIGVSDKKVYGLINAIKQMVNAIDDLVEWGYDSCDHSDILQRFKGLIDE